jgi:hypothetical protein
MYSTKVRFFPKKERTCHDSTVTFRLSFFNCIYVPRVTLFSKAFPCNQHTICTFENTSLSKSKIPPTNLYCLPGGEREVFVSITPSSWRSPPSWNLWQSLQFVQGNDEVTGGGWYCMTGNFVVGSYGWHSIFYIQKHGRFASQKNAHLPHISWELSCPGKRNRRRSADCLPRNTVDPCR